MKISFVNGNALPCGCNARFSDGGGEYSDVITFSLCEDHKMMYEDVINSHTLTCDGAYIKNISKGEELAAK